MTTALAEIEEMLLEDGGTDVERDLSAVDEILGMKKNKNAAIVAHYYMRRAIKDVLADYVGDSLDMSKYAMNTDKDIIIVAGVHFMAENAKMLNPRRKVLLPSMEAGCSLAESITAEDVLDLRRKNPGIPVASYVNTYAEVKAASDTCFTSSNAIRVISSLPGDTVIVLPDKYMARSLQKDIPGKKIIGWDGTCIVHEQFLPGQVEFFRHKYPGLRVLSHYECPGETVDLSDFHGSTSGIRKYVRENEAAAYLMLTECNMASTLKHENPDKVIVTPCNLCPYMAKINIYNIHDAMANERHEIVIPSHVMEGAEKAMRRMLELGG